MARRRMLAVAGMLAIATVVGACGDDYGTPDYPDQSGLIPVDQKYDEPDPYQLGEERLSVDVFYEGGRSETLKINGFRTHYFIFGGVEFGRDTFSIVPFGDRLEGEQSDRITLAGTVWWGGGIVWDEAIDLSEWKKLFVSFKSDDQSFARFELSLLYGAGETPRSVVVDPSKYGYRNDGEWHSLEIPLADLVASGLDIKAVRSPFIVGGTGNVAGDALLVDNLYLTRY